MCLLFIFLGTLAGLGMWLVSQNPSIMHSIQAIKADSDVFSRIGLLLLAFNILLFVVFYSLNKKVVYQVEMGQDLNVSVNKKIISEFITDFFKTEIPKKDIGFALKMGKKNLEIIADFSQLSFEEHEKVLKKKMPKLSKQLTKSFGLSTKVTLSLFCKKA